MDFKSGVVKNLTTEEIIQGIPTPEDMVWMIEGEGLERTCEGIWRHRRLPNPPNRGPLGNT